MHLRSFKLVVFFSALVLTLICGAVAFWLAFQNPMLVDKLFYAMLGLFTAGTGAIIGLVRILGAHSQVDENPVPITAVAPIGSMSHEGMQRGVQPRSERRSSRRDKATPRQSPDRDEDDLGESSEKLPNLSGSSLHGGAAMPAVLKQHDRYWGQIAIYGDYKAYKVHKAQGGLSSDYPAHSKRILDLKDGRAGAVTHFKDIIEPELEDNIVIVTVPSHDPAKTGGGLKKLAAGLAKKGGRVVDGSSCLVRTTKIDKLAHGGDRSVEVHLQSVAVQNAHRIEGKNVLLLDDVTKTGNSLEACTQLLLRAGAKVVQCATIGKT
jgi:pyrimidine operon attenuation protein/uracil phosphoribosyltransferase